MIHDEESCKEYCRSILDNLPGGFLSVDLSGTVVYGNAVAGKILHIPMDAAVGRQYREVLEPYPALREVVRGVLETGKTVLRAEVSLMHGDTEIVIGYSTLKVVNREGKLLGVGVIFQDLTLVARQKAGRAG